MVGARVRHPCVAMASRKQGVAPTSDRHGGLSDKSWPDRAINYDREFVRSLYNSPRAGKEKRKKKKEKKKEKKSLEVTKLSRFRRTL